MVLEGYGSYGIVLSNPRIPLDNEDYDSIKNLDQVSKILYSEKDGNYTPSTKEYINYEYFDIMELHLNYTYIFNSNYFMIPINAGVINKVKFINNINKYNYSWLSNSKICYNILCELIKSKDNIYQIIYERGEKIKLNLQVFFEKIKNIYKILKLSNYSGFFFDDFKYDNLILHNNKIKMIDYSELINTNKTIQEINVQLIKAKLNNIFYFPYPIIPNILLYELIGNLEIISDVNVENDNYSYLINNVHTEYYTNINYMKKLLDNLYTSSKINNCDTFVNIEVLHYTKINDIACYDDLESKCEKINVTMDTFIQSLKSILFSKINFYDLYNKKIINLTINYYKKLISKIYPTHNEQINFYLKIINIYSFGILFLEYIHKNKDLSKKSIDIKNILEKILSLIIKCCSPILIIDDDIYYSFPKYNEFFI